MAVKGYIATANLVKSLIKDIKKGIFKPVYVLMGEECYYLDLLCKEIIDNALDESERDFNQTILYGADTDADYLISAARRYPVMSQRQVVVLKDAQEMRTLDNLSIYCSQPLDTTILVILLRQGSLDKRKSLYKSLSKHGVVVESNPVKEYELIDWIENYAREENISIDIEAAQFLSEAIGNDLTKIVAEIEKIFKNLPEGVRSIRLNDVERNVGISRQFSIFELTKSLSFHKADKAMYLAAHIGKNVKFSIVPAISTLYLHFNRILKYWALRLENKNVSMEEKAKVLGVHPYFLKEYDTALLHYPIVKTMAIISLLADYDYNFKSGKLSHTEQGGLLLEIVSKILN